MKKRSRISILIITLLLILTVFIISGCSVIGSGHSCKVCSIKSSHAVTESSWHTDYYCEKHYSELKNALEHMA